MKRFEIGKSALCRLSFEPLSCIGVAWLGIIGEGTIPMALIASTMDGSLKSELMRAEFLPWSADVMAVVINLAFWMVSYGMFYWGITCYRAIFSWGLALFQRAHMAGTFPAVHQALDIKCPQCF